MNEVRTGIILRNKNKIIKSVNDYNLIKNINNNFT